MSHNKSAHDAVESRTATCHTARGQTPLLWAGPLNMNISRDVDDSRGLYTQRIWLVGDKMCRGKNKTSPIPASVLFSCQ